jgi:hypothetical protein
VVPLVHVRGHHTRGLSDPLLLPLTAAAELFRL